METRTKGQFIWHDLMTEDPKAALDFYGHVLGLTSQTVAGYDGKPYHVLCAGGVGMGGAMELLPEHKKAGMKPCWIGYLVSDDVDADVARLEKAGGKKMRPPTDIPTVGRFAPVTDPQGAGFMLFKPTPPPSGLPPVATGKGSVGWNELLTTDVNAAFGFYAEQYGFAKATTVDMGPMGPYEVFTTPGTGGGIMKDPQSPPRARWRYYFQVESVTAAIGRAKAKGGQIVSGPHEVPGGEWTATLFDRAGRGAGVGVEGEVRRERGRQL